MIPRGKDNAAKDRILDTAEKLFAQNGYHAISVRQITTEAECNLAAVNYHFGNKRNLYLEVFRSRWIPRAQRLHESFVENLAKKDVSSMRDVLHALAKAFIEGPLTDDERERHHQLMARELAKPIGALEIVAGEIQQPFFEELSDLLGQFLPEAQGEPDLTLNLLSIFSMLLFFNFARELVAYHTGCKYDQTFKERLVEHITDFCTLGIGMGQKEVGR